MDSKERVKNVFRDMIGLIDDNFYGVYITNRTIQSIKEDIAEKLDVCLVE